MRWYSLTAIMLATWCGTAGAQGLIWSLPEDGTSIRYEGDYEQIVKRPDSTVGDLTMRWRRNLTIKSVGREEAVYQGTSQPCRWIEIKSETGKTAEGILDAGPGGIRMYRLLVPESAIRGTVNEPVGEGRELFVSYIPVVKGVRRIGDEAAQEIEAGVFQLYPVVCLLQHYPDLKEVEGPQSISVPAGDFEAAQYQGTLVTETANYRSTNTATIFRSDTAPFGVVKWSVKVVNETKVTTELRSAFKEQVEMKEEMQAVSIGTGAESDFLVE